MAYRIVKNTRHNVLLMLTATNTAIVVVGNGSISEIGDLTVTDDTITSCYIKQIWSSADSSAANGWTIARGANTVWQSDSTTWLDFAGNGAPIILDSDATLSLTRTGTFGTCMIELQKTYGGGTDSDY